MALGKRLILSVFLVLLLPVMLFGWEEHPQIAKLFKEAKVQGTFVLYDVTSERFIGHNEQRANRRYVPASTFKIPHSLIGLSTGAVKNVDDVLPYTGPAKPLVPAWGHDMGLRDAIAMSNVPIYQELARRIGPSCMKTGVSLLHYGNEEIGTAVERFCLDGPLTISAIEQTKFLAQLAQNRLPLPTPLQKSVQEIIFLEAGSGWNLYGKTGWEHAPNPGIGWWVGWVEKQGRFYVFALNLDITKPEDAAKRVQLGKACLQLLNVI